MPWRALAYSSGERAAIYKMPASSARSASSAVTSLPFSRVLAPPSEPASIHRSPPGGAKAAHLRGSTRRRRVLVMQLEAWSSNGRISTTPPQWSEPRREPPKRDCRGRAGNDRVSVEVEVGTHLRACVNIASVPRGTLVPQRRYTAEGMGRFNTMLSKATSAGVTPLIRAA